MQLSGGPAKEGKLIPEMSGGTKSVVYKKLFSGNFAPQKAEEGLINVAFPLSLLFQTKKHGIKVLKVCQVIPGHDKLHLLIQQSVFFILFLSPFLPFAAIVAVK